MRFLVPKVGFDVQNAEIVRDTREGKMADRKYNAAVVVNTVRYAMIDQIKNPRPGFEEVMQQHFRLQRHRIMDFCQRWLSNCGALLEPQVLAFRKSVQELHMLLSPL